MKHVFGWMLMMVALAACGGEQQEAAKAPESAVPRYAPGQIVAEHDEPIPEDSLNKGRFTVHIVADSASNGQGSFLLRTQFEFLENDTRLVLPGSLPPARPALRRDTGAYNVIAGFVTLKDSQFYDYYRISGSREQLGIRQLKRYIAR